ncbi:MAG: hypothetical protein Q8R06_09205 [Polaromonas sp.]|uniref:hypothetical protein n=1 Tax=Polaromonas sp. TaxID=1869339 RepID=UPI002732AC6F|nr:hypothetical protein [Polaromonas sp.]MDP3797316.1 hypothetical protein [Polaromonas sp.]
MTTLEIMADSSSARTTDFVSADAANLASHMSHCASSRSRFFALHSALQSIHDLVSPRIVTVSAVLAICLGLLVVVA